MTNRQPMQSLMESNPDSVAPISFGVLSDAALVLATALPAANAPSVDPMTEPKDSHGADAALLPSVTGQAGGRPRESEGAPRDSALRVLLVEDRADDAELMVAALRDAGYAPTWTRVDAEADYLAALDDAPDVVLCDHVLPQFNSIRALELLRARCRHIPFILVSGAIGEAQALDILRRGADDYLLKDRLRRLGSAVANARERTRLQREKNDAEKRIVVTMSWLEALLQNSQALIFIKNIDGRYVYVNREFERRVGITSAQILNRTDEAVFPAEQAARFRANDRRVLSAGKPIRIEESARLADGSHLYVVAKFPLRAADGSFFGVAGIATDITERQLAEQRILRLNSLYRILSATNAIIVRARARATLLRDICKIAVENGGFVKAWFGLIDPAAGRLQAATHDGSDARYMADFQAAIENNVRDGLDPAPTAMRDGRLTVCNDLLSDPHFARWHGLAREHGFRSMAALPLLCGGQAVGVLVLKAGVVGFFDAELLALLREMADDISFALEKLELEQRHREAVSALEESDEKFRQLAGNIPQVFWITDVEQQHLLYVSPAYECVTGRRIADLGTDPLNMLQAVHPDDRGRVRHAGRNRAPLGSYDIEYRVIHVDGQVRWIRDRAFPVRDAAGAIYRIAGIAEDITERKLAEERVQQLAYYDPLTGLPNRALFQDRLGQLLAAAQRHGSIVAVLLLDLDRFKVVNDTLGHGSGDRLLQLAGERLSRGVRTGDTVGRVSGDEYAVILADLAHPEHAGLVAQKLCDALAAPFDLDGHEVFVTASVGVTVSPNDGIDTEALLKNAETAMYNAKAQGRNTYQYYTPAMLEGALGKMQLEMKLRRALEREEFVLHYQPKIDIASGEVVGVEALLRWQLPDSGLVPPAEFIPLLEETGLIVPVGEWVIDAVGAQLRAWGAAGVRQVPVAVNLSARQLDRADVGAVLERALERYGIDPRLLEIEITETSLMQQPEQARAVLTKLKRLGIRLSLDDFGTGYSSLGYLKRFPLDTVKIDRSFVHDIAADAGAAAITRAVVMLGHSLNLTVVAEGVETEEQLDLLGAYGCDEAQGYLFAPALPAERCAELLAGKRRLHAPKATGRSGRRHAVVLVDDAQSLARTAKLLHGDVHTLLTAATPQAAFELLAAHPVDAVVAGERLPGMTGAAFFGRVKQMYPDVVRIMLSATHDLPTLTEAINVGEVNRVFLKGRDDERMRGEIRRLFRQF